MNQTSFWLNSRTFYAGSTPGLIACLCRSAWIFKAIDGEQRTNWRRIFVRLRAAATRPESLYGQVAATKKADDEDKPGGLFLDRNRLKARILQLQC
ncbi:MAG TPA: hypothetical protein DIW77_08465 [Chromatiaceae bacterium]|nr:MAG: hypothetical protein N838_08050 [Thiohalocapsa sp. PB-PSB1]HCS90075.1 hypothetical protein [Chromatiaceae bacterium]